MLENPNGRTIVLHFKGCFFQNSPSIIEVAGNQLDISMGKILIASHQTSTAQNQSTKSLTLAMAFKDLVQQIYDVSFCIKYFRKYETKTKYFLENKMLFLYNFCYKICKIVCEYM